MTSKEHKEKLAAFFDLDLKSQIDMYFEVLKSTPVFGMCHYHFLIISEIQRGPKFINSIWSKYSKFTNMAMEFMTPEMWEFCDLLKDIGYFFEDRKIIESMCIYWFSYQENRIKFCDLLKNEFIKKYLENGNIGNI